MFTVHNAIELCVHRMSPCNLIEVYVSFVQDAAHWKTEM